METFSFLSLCRRLEPASLPYSEVLYIHSWDQRLGLNALILFMALLQWTKKLFLPTSDNCGVSAHRLLLTFGTFGLYFEINPIKTDKFEAFAYVLVFRGFISIRLKIAYRKRAI